MSKGDKAKQKKMMEEWDANHESEEGEDAANNDTKKKKSRRVPGQPKKPISAYFYFYSMNRESLKEKNPEATFGELVRC